MPTNQRELSATENVLNQEPVNQQMLAALKLGKNSLVAFKFMPAEDGNAWEEHDEANLVAINAAIAAAEAAHPVGQQYLLGGRRFKVTHSQDHGFAITGLPQTMNGQWVAFVDATDNCHMQQQPASAQPVAVPDEWHQFVKDISQQEPEKPDYWNSCGQCARNIDRAEYLIDAAQGNLDLNVPDEVMKDAARWKIIKQLASEDGGHALSILVMYCGLTECDTDALDAAIDKVIAENTAAQKPEGGE